MITPEFLKKGDLIAFTSPSNGIVKEKKKLELDKAKELFVKNKIRVIEDKYTRFSDKGESSSSLNRARELEKCILNKDIKMLLPVTGGDFLIEILDKVNLDLFKENIKWIQGHSDITVLLFLITTKYDIKTIYFSNAASLGKLSDIEFTNNLNILLGNKVIQKAFSYQSSSDNENNIWQSKKDLDVVGRIIGGYIGCLIDLIGTKYDYALDFIEKYKNDGIIWYFDINYISNEELLRQIWHIKNAGWFKYTKCILFGRGDNQSYTGITLDEAIERGLGDNIIPYITNFDLGHTEPRITIVNGSIVNIVYNNNNKQISLIE